MLELQKFLQSGQSLESLEDRFAISSKRHSKYPNLILFKYNQISSDFSLKIVQKSRGIILDEKDNYNIVSIAYDKFFNYGETQAKSINWSNCKCLEKLDGSLMILYYYTGDWHCQSSGNAEAGGMVNNVINLTFKELFWKVWNELDYKLPIDTNLCYAFELCTLYNKIVVQHPKNRLVLHGIRNRVTLEEYNLDAIAKFKMYYGWEIVKSYPLNNIEDCLKAANELNAIHNEGFVVVDDKFNRVKIKSPSYVSLHHLKSSFSLNRLLDIVKSNEGEELIASLPEFKEIFDELKNKFIILIQEMEDYWQSIKHIEDKKDFALEAVKSRYPDCLFRMKQNKFKTAKEYMLQCRNENILEVLKVKPFKGVESVE